MKNAKIFLFLGGLLFIMSSCSPKLTPFTQKLYDQNKWSESELKSIQFYLSEDIVLRREASSGSSTIEGGEIKMVDGKKLEEVVVKEGTPGVLVFLPKQNRFAVSFESENDERYLMFGPNPKAGNRYVLLASDWKRNRGKVSYDGKPFFTPSQSAYAALLVDLKKVRKVSVKSHTAKGRKIK